MLQRLLHYLQATEKEQFQLLERLVLQSSFSADKQGVEQLGLIIREALAECNLHLSVEHVDQYGDNLVFQSAACSTKHPYILLLGHMDTVFPLGSSFNLYREDDTKAYGPGVCDMKGGLVTAIYLLKALHHNQLLETIPLVLICNSDEEVGSPESTDLIKRYGQNSLCGLVFECGGINGEVVSSRKGKAGYHLDVIGKAGHAAFSRKGGKASAVLELAHKIIQIERLNAPEKEIVINVGKISGGMAANVVADRASAEIDTRFITDSDGLTCQKSIEEITYQSTIPGTMGVVKTTNSRFPMRETEKNLALFRVIADQAEKLGLSINKEARSGVSDANTLAECNIGVIDGLGPIGDLDHSENEYIIKSTLLQRCTLATLSVVEIWERWMRGELPLN